MTQEQFEALGIEKSLAKKAAEESDKELKGYVSKDTFDAAEQQRKQLETSVNDYKTQLETLKTDAGDNETLKTQIADLQDQNKKKDEEYQAQLKELRMTNAIKLAIADSAQDSDLVAGLIDKTKLILGDDGKVTGLDEQIKSLKESKAFLFKSAKQEPDPKPSPGFKLGVSPAPAQNQNSSAGISLKDAVSEAINKTN